MPTYHQKAMDNIKLSKEFRERAIRLLPIAKDFVANRDPEDVLEYTKSIDPRDAYGNDIRGALVNALEEKDKKGKLPLS